MPSGDGWKWLESSGEREWLKSEDHWWKRMNLNLHGNLHGEGERKWLIKDHGWKWLPSPGGQKWKTEHK
ncbi:hypothetical protein AGMMS50233_07250 [Endomicrobiia bacterium]|nr:hypothetical protein AGMMS50233_07250 [Endomicrobiia bacterium]